MFDFFAALKQRFIRIAYAVERRMDGLAYFFKIGAAELLVCLQTVGVRHHIGKWRTVIAQPLRDIGNFAELFTGHRRRMRPGWQ